MGSKTKKELKHAEDVDVNDNIKVGGLLCTVTKVEHVFHRTPEARTRMTLKIVGATASVDEVLIFLARRTLITIQK